MVVDAYQFNRASLCDETVWPAWLDLMVQAQAIRFHPDEPTLADVETGSGTWSVSDGDWLVRMPDGDVTVFETDIFALVFQHV